MPMSAPPNPSDQYQNNGYGQQYGMASQVPPSAAAGFQSPPPGPDGAPPPAVIASPVPVAGAPPAAGHKSRRMYAAEQYAFGTAPVMGADPSVVQPPAAPYGQQQPVYGQQPQAPQQTSYGAESVAAPIPDAAGVHGQPAYGGFQPIGAQTDAGLSQQFSQMNIGAAPGSTQPIAVCILPSATSLMR